MPSIAELIGPILDRPPIAAEATRPLSTGLAVLDEASYGGFFRGQVWLLYGPCGSGRSTLAAQWALAAAAQTDTTVLLGLAALDIHTMVMKILAAEAKVLLSHLLTGALSESDVNRLNRVRSDLEAQPLDLLDVRSVTVDPIKELAPAAHRRMVVVDDVQLITLDVSALLETWRACALRHGSTLLVTATQDAAIRHGSLRTEWARFIDVTVQVTPPPAFGDGVSRLNLTHLPWQRQHLIELAAQPHYGRLVDRYVAEGE